MTLSRDTDDYVLLYFLLGGGVTAQTLQNMAVLFNSTVVCVVVIFSSTCHHSLG